MTGRAGHRWHRAARILKGLLAAALVVISATSPALSDGPSAFPQVATLQNGPGGCPAADCAGHAHEAAAPHAACAMIAAAALLPPEAVLPPAAPRDETSADPGPAASPPAWARA